MNHTQKVNLYIWISLGIGLFFGIPATLIHPWLGVPVTFLVMFTSFWGACILALPRDD